MSDIHVAATKSVRGAVRFLLDSRTQTLDAPSQGRRENELAHFWKDFSVFGRSSDEWITAYTATALAATGDSEACDAAHDAWRFLTAQRPLVPAGLGYNREAPRDADSTLWGCRLSVLLGRTTDDWHRRAIEFLAGAREKGREPPLKGEGRPPNTGCVRPDGGIATYPSANCLPMETGNNTLRATQGWTSSHACVTASATWLKELLAAGDLIGFLERAQSWQGYWTSYWWVDREYATAHALESLSRHGLQNELIERGVAWLESRPVEASSFQLGLRIIGIAAAHPGRADTLLPRLLALQLDNGSWPSSSRMRIPPPDLRDPDVRWNWDETSDGFGGIVVDRARIFTTATAVRALTSCLVR